MPLRLTGLLRWKWKVQLDNHTLEYLHMTSNEPVTLTVERATHRRLLVLPSAGKNVQLHHTIICAAHSSIDYTFILRDTTHVHIDIHLVGEGATVKVRGIYVLAGNERVTIATHQHHQVAGATSDVRIKGILADAAHAVYHGIIRVEEQARQTHAAQNTVNLLLSPQAQASAQPTLEVLTNDVRCAHGSAVGQLDAAQMLYVQSRGLNQVQARALLLEGFLAEIIQDPALVADLVARVQ
jgi:Fe-S cluster assembly scaffold protein SufB